MAKGGGAFTVDEYMASVGVDMLHAGGMEKTDELADMCRISVGKLVLDAGCGFGKTACHLAKTYGCRVVGIDLSERMIEGARERARRKRACRSVDFRLGNVENMDFKDQSFDAVISEGTTVLTDKEKALREYARVAKSGGYVGLNELSWRRQPAEPLVRKTLIDLQGVSPMTYDQWIKLLVDSGLKDVQSKAYRYSSTSWNIIRSLGPYSLIRVGIRYLTNPELRRWVNRQEALFRQYSAYWGYGLYTGRK